MSVAERLCDRIFMIFRAARCSTARSTRSRRSTATTPCASARAAGAAALAGLPGVESVDRRSATSRTCGCAATRRRSCARSAAPTAVQHFELTKPSLHDIFVRIARPTADELARQPGGVRHDAHSRRRPHRVPGPRPGQGVHHRHPDDAGADRPVDRVSDLRRAGRPMWPTTSVAVIDRTGVLYDALASGRRRTQPREHGTAARAQARVFLLERVDPADRPARDVEVRAVRSRARSAICSRSSTSRPRSSIRHATDADQVRYYTETPSYYDAAQLAPAPRSQREVTAAAIRHGGGRCRRWSSGCRAAPPCTTLEPRDARGRRHGSRRQARRTRSQTVRHAVRADVPAVLRADVGRAAVADRGDRGEDEPHQRGADRVGHARRS